MILPVASLSVDLGVLEGVTWATCWGPFGAVNGYAQLPRRHPWWDRDALQGADGPWVHGGITYGPDADGWVGFDTVHYCDCWPGSGSWVTDPEMMPPYGTWDGEPLAAHRPHRWTADLVAVGAMDLAAQIAAATRTAPPGT